MTELDASAVAKLLTEFGQRTALRGGNPYRARAYARAAENLLALSQPLQDIIAQDRLREIPGIGQAIADIVAKLHRTGTHPAPEAMRKEGIESDILPDGSLDYPAAVLDRFDFVVASVHSRFRLGREEQTQRIIRAVSDPHTTILGHMTGRQLLRRPGYEVDIERVLKACSEHGVAVETNANPWRLDLDWRWHRRALELGCLMSINPDAHSTSELDLTHWGVEMARKGWVPKTRVLNCLESQGVLAISARPTDVSSPGSVGGYRTRRCASMRGRYAVRRQLQRSGGDTARSRCCPPKPAANHAAAAPATREAAVMKPMMTELARARRAARRASSTICPTRRSASAGANPVRTATNRTR